MILVSSLSDVTSIFGLFSPLISAYLVYYFGIKGKRKDTDFEKERELNVVLSNALLVWNYISRLELLSQILADEKTDSIVPRKYFSFFVLKTGILNDNCFKDLDDSVVLLKKYDPIQFFKIEGLGNSLSTIKEKFILPILKNPNTPLELVNLGAKKVIRETLGDLEENLKVLSKKISKEVHESINQFISDHLKSDAAMLIKEINEKYYALMMEIIPQAELGNFNLDEFILFSKTEEYKKIVEMQLEVIVNDTYDQFINIISADPSLSIEEIQLQLTNVNKNAM